MNSINSNNTSEQASKRPYKTRDSFWDVVRLVRGGKIFKSSEKSYLKIVPNGWLMRHVFFKGKRFTSSAIIFFSDINGIWNNCDFNIYWEHINTRSIPNNKFLLHRLRTPEGWVVKEFLTTKSSSSTVGVLEISLTYVPDSEHKWVV